MRTMAILAALSIAAYGQAGADNRARPPAGATSALPADAVILNGSAVATMLRQCSRAAPAAGEDTWQPTAADIAALEAALPAALAARQRPELTGASQGWYRQYGGIVRGGRRFIYGNFIPHPPATDPVRPDADRWRSDVAIICDGGPAFFGVEYDLAAGRFTQIAFNGSV